MSEALAQCRLLITNDLRARVRIPANPTQSCSLSRYSLGQAMIHRSPQPPTICWMENEYQLQLGVKWLVQWQEELDHKDRFGSGMVAIAPSVCSYLLA
jgi:hypothetical protein